MVQADTHDLNMRSIQLLVLVLSKANSGISFIILTCLPFASPRHRYVVRSEVSSGVTVSDGSPPWHQQFKMLALIWM